MALQGPLHMLAHQFGRMLAAAFQRLPRFGVREAYIFGSLAQPGRYHAESDIDIAVVWEDRRDFFGMAGEVSRALGQDIDILPLEKIPFADKIKREGIRWVSETRPSGRSGSFLVPTRRGVVPAGSARRARPPGPGPGPVHPCRQ